MLHICVLTSFDEIDSFKKKNREETSSCLLNATSAFMGVTPPQSRNVFGTGERRSFLKKTGKSWNLRKHPIFFYEGRQGKIATRHLKRIPEII